MEPYRYLPIRPETGAALLEVLMTIPEGRRIVAGYANAAGVPPTAAIHLATSGLFLQVPGDVELTPIGLVEPEPPAAPAAGVVPIRPDVALDGALVDGRAEERRVRGKT